jgi:hypothetical protein
LPQAAYQDELDLCWYPLPLSGHKTGKAARIAADLAFALQILSTEIVFFVGPRAAPSPNLFPSEQGEG